MKIVSWNVNGIRSLKPGVKEILANLNGDVICLQETKLTRNQLEETTAFIDGYTSYFSFPRHISGYSGVATYCKNSCRPIHAEEGLLGLINAETFNQYPLKDDFHLSELQQLQNEGRVLITEHLLRCDKEEKLAVINVYCPRADPDRPERKEYKLKFYQILQYRTEEYLKKNYHVIIIGDINTAHKPVDHCDPGNTQEFSEEPARKWLDSFLCNPVSLENTEGEQSKKGGLMVDTFRYFNPNQQDAFTCWNSRTNARMNNYGTRIDYIMTNRTFLPFVKESIIQPEVQGSDHCPIAAVIHCTPVPAEQTPKICTRNWPEFAGKQQTLLAFLQSNCIQPDNTKNSSSMQSISYKKQQGLKIQKSITQFLATNNKQVCSENEDSLKKPRTVDAANICSSFEDSSGKSDTTFITSNSDSEMKPQDAISHDSNGKLKRKFRDEDPVSKHNSNETSNFQQKQIWRTLLSGPPPPPLCKGHKEPCVLRTVKREGVNNGRQFFTCCKANGPPSNPNSSCNHFEWVKMSNKIPKKS